MYKIAKFKFCNIFTKLPKSASALARLDKISKLEYFGIIDERQTSRNSEVLIKELVDFMGSNTFSKEFKYCISNDTKKNKFLLLNVALLAHRLKHEKINLIDYERWLQQKILVFLFTFSPL